MAQYAERVLAREQAAAAGLPDPEVLRRAARENGPFLHGGAMHMVGSGTITAAGALSIDGSACIDLSGRGLLEPAESTLDLIGELAGVPALAGEAGESRAA